jgi:two-component system, sensor histidine kinase YesM
MLLLHMVRYVYETAVTLLKALRERVLIWRNSTTIRKQLSLVLGLTVSLAMALIIMFSYLSQADAIIVRQVSMLRRVLAMELASFDKYVAEQRAFSIQLRNNGAFMTLLMRAAPFDYEARQLAESVFKTYFYSRGDFVSMDLYLIRQKLKLSLAKPVRKIGVLSGADPSLLPDYADFTAKPDFCSVTVNSKGLLEVTRTIIDSPRDTPLAVVRFTLDASFTQALEQSHEADDERLCILGAEGVYLMPAGAQADDISRLKLLQAGSADSAVLRIGGRDTLCVMAGGSGYGFTLVGLKPMAVVSAPLILTRNGSILLGIISLAATLLMLIYSIKFITNPLSKLAHRIRRVGSGNFTTKAALEGSYEIRGLSEDVNQMMDGISHLISTTYLAQLNERTAQLTALQAQTNPHFLFNTLQVISTQAIVCGQESINSMVIALASLLRYSIKGGNLAALGTEFEYVEKYLSLQKARFGERLIYDCRAETALMPLPVPKLGLLSLAENSIIHGLSGTATCIQIAIEATVEHGNMLLRVVDDGSGVEPDKLSELRQSLADPDVTITQNIGLMNLASRLKLLYRGRARIEISSRTNPPCETAVCITIPMEVLESVQGTFD